MPARWEGDERGSGVADARALVPGASQLVEALGQPRWVAEEPDAHLVPHIEGACRDGLPIALESIRAEEDGALAVELRWTGRRGDARAARRAAYALVGSVAESASYIRQRRTRSVPDIDAVEGGGLLYEVATGMLAGDTPFAPHGHTLRLRISGVF